MSRPYALKPLNQESICNEWYLHPNKELYKFNLKDGWERNPEYEKPSKNYIPKMSLEDINFQYAKENKSINAKIVANILSSMNLKTEFTASDIFNVWRKM